MSKVDIEITPWLSEEGVISSLWFGDSGEPAYEETTPYKQLINQSLESYTIRGVIRKIDYDDAAGFVRALEAAAWYARTRLNELREE